MYYLDSTSNSETTSKKYSFVYVSAIIILLLYFVLSASTSFAESIEEHGTIFYYARTIIFPLALICLLIDTKPRLLDLVEYFLLFALGTLSYLSNKEIPSTSIMIIPGIILFDQIKKNAFCISGMTIKVISCLAIFQILLYSTITSIYKGYLQIVNSGKDPNYTAFSLIILFFLSGAEKENKMIQKRDYLLLLCLFTYSRTGLLYIFAILFFRFTNTYKHKLCKAITSHPLIVFIIIQIIWGYICIKFVDYFNDYTYDYDFHQGLSRFNTVFDGSNYMRAAMNAFLIRDVSLSHILFGYNRVYYNDAILDYISRFNNPHNSFFSIYVQSGAIYSFCLLRRTIALFKGKFKYIPIFVFFLIYSTILGPSVYYGIDSILFLLVIKFQDMRTTNDDKTNQN